MYKLLLVSDKEEIRSLYRRYAEWNTLGFEQPGRRGKTRSRALICSAIAVMMRISSLLSVSEGKKFFAYLSRRPEMLGMETAGRGASAGRSAPPAARSPRGTRARQSKQVDDYTKALQGEFCDLPRRGL